MQCDMRGEIAGSHSFNGHVNILSIWVECWRAVEEVMQCLCVHVWGGGGQHWGGWVGVWVGVWVGASNSNVCHYYIVT